MTVLDLTGRKALVTGGSARTRGGDGAGAGRRRRPRRGRGPAGRPRREGRRRRSGEGHGFVAPRRDRRRELGDAAVADAVGSFGGLDILVNNAGIEITSLITEVDADDVRTMLEVNVLGTALGIKHGLRTMRPGGLAGNGGSIINVASVAATIAFPGIAVYSATKSAVDRLTRVAAMEAGKLGYGVRVNCIYPGLVPDRHGRGARQRRGRARPVRLARGGGRRGRRADARPAGSARSPTWPTPWSSWPPTPPASSTASACRSTAEWGCEPMSDKPVVVYGASGYTGRLICEYLREYNVPFVAAGRDEDKLKASMDGNVAGIETADYEVVEVDARRRGADRAVHAAPRWCSTPSARSASSAPRSSRPASPPARTTLDTTGEQDWLITCDEKYGADFAAAGLLLAPGIAQMYTTGEIAAELCLETPGPRHPRHRGVLGRQPDDRLDADDPGQRGARPAAHYLEQNAYVPWDPEAGLYQLAIPGQHELALALPWGGTVAPGLVQQRPAGRQLQGARRGLQQGADARRARRSSRLRSRRPRTWTPDEQYAALAATAAQVMNHDAAAREPAAQQVARLGARLRSARPGALRHPRQQNYKQTGLLQAYAAYSLLQQPPQAGRVRLGLPGVRAPRAARRAAQLRAGVGAGPHRPGLSVVRLVDYLDKGASLGPGRALPDHRRPQRVVRRGAGAQLPHRGGAGPRRGRAGGQGRDPVGQRPGRVHLRVRDQPGRRGVVPDQPAQRGGREPRAARPLRLHRR